VGGGGANMWKIVGKYLGWWKRENLAEDICKKFVFNVVAGLCLGGGVVLRD